MLILAGLAGAQSAAATATDALRDQLQIQATRLGAQGGLYVQGLPIASGPLLPEFYAARNYEPVWTGEARLGELFALLETAESHGLSTTDYNLQGLRELHRRVRELAASTDATAAAQALQLGASLDLLATESLVRFGYHQRFGKVNPNRLEPTWNFTREFRPGRSPLSTLQDAVAAPSLSVFLGQWIERAPLYRALQNMLATHRVLAAAGGWPIVPDGPTLREGDRDAQVPAVRARLAVTDGLAAAGDDADLYDADMAAAVRRFQERHGLDADGVVGRGTRTAMNVPVEARIDQIRLSLERARWVIDDTAGQVIVVNIAAFEVYAARDGQPFWTRRVVVGREARQTPIFKGSMTYIELNPTWTVPPTILREDVLPNVRRDPGYLQANRIRVLDRNGRAVDPATVDWSSAGSRSGYTFRQDPGPGNSLGRIKFMFPNPHAIYLHDTPSKALFERAERLFSSGCIRVEDPLALADIVLDEPGRWNEARLASAIETGRTQTVRLARPWPVLILYLTADVGPDGQVRFHRDFYDRDPPLLRALNGAVRIDFPEA